MIVKCANCKKEFYARPSDIKKGKGKYCSRKCYSDSQIGRPSPKKGKILVPKVEVACEYCNEKFKVHRSRYKRGKVRYCSLSCHRKDRTGSRAPAWKGGEKKNGDYIICYAPHHPNSTTERPYINRSQLIVEKHLKRFLADKEVVHHINGIKDDDRIENLYLFPSQSEHQRYHRLSMSKKCELITSSNIC
jgi:hypothetical protein